MSTLEEFESAPVGATARHPDGRRAIRAGDRTVPWLTTWGNYNDHDEMANLGYVLDPLPPSTAREALDLAWDLAHPVKKGQVIRAGTGVISREESGIAVECPVIHQTVDGRPLWMDVRTLDPLPDPEPDWLDAPAVIAAHTYRDDQVLWENCDGIFVNATLGEADWSELRDVTPLYPREEQS